MQQSFDKKSFSKEIRTKRLILENMGLREAAAEIGVNHSTLSRMENQLFTPHMNHMLKVCDWLEKSVCIFIKTKK